MVLTSHANGLEVYRGVSDYSAERKKRERETHELEAAKSSFVSSMVRLGGAGLYTISKESICIRRTRLQ